MTYAYATNNLYRLEGHANYGRSSGFDQQGNGHVIFYVKLLS
jgi:hypothetical protein